MTKSTVRAMMLKTEDNAETKVSQNAVDSTKPSFRPFEWDAPKIARHNRSRSTAQQRHTIVVIVRRYTLCPIILKTSATLARTFKVSATAWPAIRIAGSCFVMFCDTPFEADPDSMYH